MHDDTVIVLAIVTENVTRSESWKGTPISTWWAAVGRQWVGPVNLWSKEVACRAVGYPANSAAKYLFPGAVVILVGRLVKTTIPNAGGTVREEMHIEVEQIGYQSPRLVWAAAQKRCRAW